ncbi:MAG TPA: bifunctional DedA family/phosphatase PAP2 family protein, partial [Solirubrobacteraceae bacterium]|nr:bifunctional DedA family/phosphatase PAP2 family protein [Solirubrobacteraceae bacterium]
MKPVWLLAAVALAVFLVVRRRRLEPTLLIGGALAFVGLGVYGSGVVHFPNLQKALEDLGRNLGAWTYALVAVSAFLETGAFVGLLAPGETVMLVGGLVAGQGEIDVLRLIGLAWTAAVAGDVTSFMLGRRLGREFLVRHGPKVSITEERLEKVEGFFARHGGKAILLGRFVGLVRAIAPFLAGSSGLQFRRFLPYDIIGAGLWSSTLILLGYIFWASFDRVVHYAEQGALALGTVIVVGAGLTWFVRWIRDDANRRAAGAFVARQAERPALRPVVAVVLPVWRRVRRPLMWVGNRLMPGELGLELTTLLAVLGVSSFVFVANASAAHQSGLGVFDADGLRMADRLYAGWAVDVSKVLTELGSYPVTSAIALLTAFFLVWRREVSRAVLLLVGQITLFALVHILKDAFDRPRPARPLTAADLSAFPSGHATYVVTWVAVAILLTRAMPTVASRFGFVLVSIAIAAVVGATRVYLRVHYPSDVFGGLALGTMVYAILAL